MLMPVSKQIGLSNPGPIDEKQNMIVLGSQNFTRIFNSYGLSSGFIDKFC